MIRTSLVLAAIASVTCAAQYGGTTADDPSPMTMPQDRVSDSYAIYSLLLPLGETASWKATMYVVRDATITALPAGAPCFVPPAKTALDRARSGVMNPHVAVTPPEDQRQDYDEILTDFDSRCHDRYVLNANTWHAKLPVHLLRPSEQSQFQIARSSPNEKNPFVGATSLYGVSPVYFNAHHTVALVYATHWCGGLCGEGFWIALKKENGSWKQLSWSSASWIS